MQITFLGHAGFLVTCSEDVILCDPWFSPFGAYAASWFPFPANASVDITQLERATHLYISHWHQDHLDRWFLNSRSREFKDRVIVIIPKFQYPHLIDPVREWGYRNIVEVEDELRTTNGTRIYIQRDENPLYSDSSITIATEDAVFVNSNDCKLTIGQEEEIVKRFGAVTVYAAQFSGATFHPTCYDYPSETKREISTQRRAAKFQRILHSMQRLGATTYIPSAGPACFLSDDLFALNRNPETVFSTSGDFRTWLDDQPQPPWDYRELLPGQTFSCNARDSHRNTSSVIGEEYDSADYLAHYAADRAEEIRNELARFDHPVSNILEATKQHFRELLDTVPELARKANVTLEMKITNVGSFFVDTAQGVIYDVRRPIVRNQRYEIEISEFWMCAIVGAKIRWEDFILAFRFRIHRSPDVYNEAFIAFLHLDSREEREDYMRHLDLLSRRDCERIQRYHNGKLLEYDRYCPHNCEDLSEATIEEGVLTCPRHFWRFSLEDGCGLNNPGSIHAVEVETRNVDVVI